jgi:hypothetical protein
VVIPRPEKKNSAAQTSFMIQLFFEILDVFLNFGQNAVQKANVFVNFFSNEIHRPIRAGPL